MGLSRAPQEKQGLVRIPGEHFEIVVNWLHAAAHDFPCQLRNSGRFRAGAGWAVGEQIEHLWSLTRVSLLLL